jgi:hypothetical protein
MKGLLADLMEHHWEQLQVGWVQGRGGDQVNGCSLPADAPWPSISPPLPTAPMPLLPRLLQAVDYCEVFRNMHIRHEQNQVGAAWEGGEWVPCLPAYGWLAGGDLWGWVARGGRFVSGFSGCCRPVISRVSSLHSQPFSSSCCCRCRSLRRTASPRARPLSGPPRRHEPTRPS